MDIFVYVLSDGYDGYPHEGYEDQEGSYDQGPPWPGQVDTLGLIRVPGLAGRKMELRESVFLFSLAQLLF